VELAYNHHVGSTTTPNPEPAAMTTATTSRAERREAIENLRDERDELDCDLVGLYEELKDLREKIAAMKSRKAQIRMELSELRHR
jgi:uncharacterized coiled-coil DUF342 family protein